jgi:hypothetical protein
MREGKKTDFSKNIFGTFSHAIVKLIGGRKINPENYGQKGIDNRDPKRYFIIGNPPRPHPIPSQQ